MKRKQTTNDAADDAGDLVPADVVAALKKLSPAERTNASALYTKYLCGETQKWQEAKLYAWGIIKTNGKETPIVSDVCESQEALASRMAAHYQNPDGSNLSLAQIAVAILAKPKE